VQHQDSYFLSKFFKECSTLLHGFSLLLYLQKSLLIGCIFNRFWVKYLLEISTWVSSWVLNSETPVIRSVVSKLRKEWGYIITGSVFESPLHFIIMIQWTSYIKYLCLSSSLCMKDSKNNMHFIVLLWCFNEKNIRNMDKIMSCMWEIEKCQLWVQALLNIWRFYLQMYSSLIGNILS
jgi:hypothetical protein